MAQDRQDAPLVRCIVAVSRTVADLDRTETFYRDALGFAAVAPPEPVPEPILAALGLAGTDARRLRMRLGGQMLAFLAFDPPGTPYPLAARANDPVFQHVAIPVRAMEPAAARLVAHHPAAISTHGPQALPPASGGVTAFKFRDPDGHPVELIHFPGGAPAARWQDAPGLFLGIDHSALAVTDLERALAVFRDALGFRVVQRGLNRGEAQARLDGLPDPEVDVLALEPAASRTLHLELLHYRRPAAPPSPPPYGPRDRATSRLVLAVRDLDAAADALDGAGCPVRRTGGVAYAEGPDCHGLLLVPAA
ncbi:VOC family protein [Methylobacterium radiodurans]|uniref:Glyoxalase n=1 Tax=Methylobacterium radiodurans TaxID=2202828 RepID=A0A2U8VWC9_9HYPH|nr:VOC family protein [Methylobacterium radiodurans]AWN37600.1 glyoxalase [Methylobacterium radiodurans]